MIQVDNRRSQRLVAIALTIILALFYSASMVIAANKPLILIIAMHGGNHGFVSGLTQIVFLRFVVGVWSLLTTFLQSIILGVLFVAITRAHRPTILDSWRYVLCGQIPFMLLVFILNTCSHSLVSDILSQSWIHQLFAWIVIVVYAVFAYVKKRVEISRLMAFILISGCANTVLLLLTSGIVLR